VSHKDFRANLGKFGQNIFCTPKKLPAPIPMRVVWKAGVQGVQAHPQILDLLKSGKNPFKIWAKSLKIRTKSLNI